jgi:hypothetical protein
MEYKNSRDDRIKPDITPNEKAPMIARAVELMSTGN